MQNVDQIPFGRRTPHIVTADENDEIAGSFPSALLRHFAGEAGYDVRFQIGISGTAEHATEK
jgi:hypothetical protein